MGKKVAFVLASEVLGGHEFQAAQLVRLVRVFREVEVLLNSAQFVPLFDGLDVKVTVHQGLFFTPGHVLSQVQRGIRRRHAIQSVLLGFDEVVVCAGTVEAGMTVGWACFGHRRTDLYLPFLYDRQVQWGVVGRVYTLGLHLLLNVYSRIITINRIQARIISTCYRGPVLVVDNHVAPVRPAPATSEDPRLVFIGRLDSQKRVVELIQALDFDGNPFSELLLIGDGPLRDRVEAAAAGARHLSVKLLGWLDMTAQDKLLRRADILLLNSAIEGEPMVIREAAARGMLSVVADIPGVRGITSKNLRFDSPATLRALIQHLSDPAVAEAFRDRRFRQGVDRSAQARRAFAPQDGAHRA